MFLLESQVKILLNNLQCLCTDLMVIFAGVALTLIFGWVVSITNRMKNKNTWHSFIWKERRTEIFVAILCIAVFLMGIFLDIMKCIQPFDVDPDLSATIMQTQASVAVVILAVIALISGSMSDSYWGIPIANYYMNIRPLIFRQKRCIFLALILSLAAVCFCLVEWHWSVVCCFASTILIVIMSVSGIYLAFRSKLNEHFEIESYVKELLASGKTEDSVETVLRDFINDWCELVGIQDSKTYENYKALYILGVKKLFEFRTGDGIKNVQENAYNMLSKFIVSDKTVVQSRGISLLNEIYEELWLIIRNNEEWKSIAEFSLFDSIVEDLYKEISLIEPEVLVKSIDLFKFFDLVLRDNLWLESYQTEEMYETDMRAAVDFARIFGRYLARYDADAVYYNKSDWEGNICLGILFRKCNIPSINADKYSFYMYKICFNYYSSMIYFKQNEIVKNGLYRNGMGLTLHFDNKYVVKCYISFHIYVYYLAKRDECVDPEVRKSAKYFLEDDEIKRIFIDFLSSLQEYKEFLNLEMAHEIESDLSSYEVLPRNGTAKRMVMQDVVREAWLFIILYLYDQFLMREVLDSNLDLSTQFEYFSERNESHVKGIFKELYLIISDQKDAPDRAERVVDDMYHSFVKASKKKQKEEFSRKAKADQDKYLKDTNENEICEVIKEKVERAIRDTFGEIVNFETDGFEMEWPVLQLNDFTSRVSSNSLDGLYSNLTYNLYKHMLVFLEEKDVIDTKGRRKDFKDTEEFLYYLRNNQYDIFLGSKHVIRGRDYKGIDLVNVFLNDENISVIFMPDNKVLALRKNAVVIGINSISVSIHPTEIKDSEAKVDKESGKYLYKIQGDLHNEFTKDELEDFLHDYRKTIVVKLKVKIQISSKKIGVIIIDV